MDGSKGFEGMFGSEPFSKFWTEAMSKMAPAGFTAPAAVTSDEMTKQMRQAFLDAWAKYCEEFMSSEPFLDAMKQSMDGALAFRRQVNDFLTKALQDNQIPSLNDTDSIVQTLRGLEERVLDRLEEVARRVDALEQRDVQKEAPKRSSNRNAEKSKR